MKDDKKKILSAHFLPAVLFYVAMALTIILGKRLAMATVWFLLGSACLSRGIVLWKKAKEDKTDE